MSLGDNIKSLRGQSKWTQADLSKWSGIKVGHISKLENNESDPKLSTIYKLMNALNCSGDELLMDENYSPLSGTVKQCFQRVERLEPEDKKILIHVIHKYCDAQSYNHLAAELSVAQNPQEAPDDVREMHYNSVGYEENKYDARVDKFIEHEQNLKSKE
jgi:transcriptional regulator with XRE-family HTH domain